MVDNNKGSGAHGDPVHVYLVNPPIENPWATQGEYRQDRRRGAILFWAQLFTAVAAVVTMIAFANMAVDNMARAVSAIKEMSR